MSGLCSHTACICLLCRCSASSTSCCTWSTCGSSSRRRRSTQRRLILPSPEERRKTYPDTFGTEGSIESSDKREQTCYFQFRFVCSHLMPNISKHMYCNEQLWFYIFPKLDLVFLDALKFQCKILQSIWTFFYGNVTSSHQDVIFYIHVCTNLIQSWSYSCITNLINLAGIGPYYWNFD